MDSKEVLILGAGFSRAVSEHLPLTDKLGADAVEVADIPAVEFRGGNFETWLSQLAEEQPYRSEAERYEKRAAFLRITSAMEHLLRIDELVALAQEAPSWLYALIDLAHHRQTDIITLNYDTLIEVAVASHGLFGRVPGGIADRRVSPDDVLEGLPPVQRAGVPLRTVTYDGELAPLVPSFRLWKLHGSLDWYWSPGDWTGATLRRLVTVEAFAAENEDNPRRREQDMPGLEPFIVPPTATKSEYFRNPLTRQIWRSAFRALKRANAVTLIGYSFPSADFVMSGMFGEALRDRRPVMRVVNPDPNGPVSRLKEMGVEEVQITAGERCVADFVKSYCDQASLEVLTSLYENAGNEEALLSLEWGAVDGQSRPYAEEVWLNDSAHDVYVTGNDQTGGPGHEPLRLSKLRPYLAGAYRLHAVTPDGAVMPIVAKEVWSPPAASAADVVISLHAAGKATLAERRPQSLQKVSRTDT